MNANVKPIDLDSLQRSATQACGLLKVLANRDRLLLLCQMSQGECSVNDLESMTGIKQPTLSQQLTILREEQMVNTRRDGKQIFYSLASTEAMAVMQVLHEQFCNDTKGVKK